MVPEFCIESERISYSTKHLWATIKNHIKSIRPRGAHTIIAGRVTLSKQNEGKCWPSFFLNLWQAFFLSSSYFPDRSV